MARRFGLFAFAGLIAIFGLGMTNVAGFYALQSSMGPVWAAVLIAIGDFVLAVIVMLMGRSSQPGPEIDLAFDVRKMAIEAIQADARDFKGAIGALVETSKRPRIVLRDSCITRWMPPRINFSFPPPYRSSEDCAPERSSLEMRF